MSPGHYHVREIGLVTRCRPKRHGELRRPYFALLLLVALASAGCGGTDGAAQPTLAGAVDVSLPDVGALDSGAPDAQALDAAILDSGPADTGAPELPPTDASVDVPTVDVSAADVADDAIDDAAADDAVIDDVTVGDAGDGSEDIEDIAVDDVATDDAALGGDDIADVAATDDVPAADDTDAEDIGAGDVFVPECATGQDCDDGDACTVDVCTDGVCGPKTPATCDDGNACNGIETCDEVAGCLDGLALVCDDGDACNGVETCVPATGCAAGIALTCDDQNECNGVETCDTSAGCEAGTPMVCGDGNVCNGAESCVPGLGCAMGLPTTCDDGNACNGVETCDASLGCQSGPALVCNDGDVCNGLETCAPETGCVVGTALTCDDHDACNGLETCDSKLGCRTGAPLTCDDHDACNGLESCEASAGCLAGTPLACDDQDACNGVETCDATSGCGTGVGLVCDDGDACNGQERCDAAAGCLAGTPLACDDGLPCTGVETCDSAMGCQSGTPPVGCCTSDATCDDGDVCTGAERCEPNTHTCELGTHLSCDDGDACNGAETCDKIAGCQAGLVPTCDDHDVCNGVETCDKAAGCQAGAVLMCDDGDACNGRESCDPAVGCRAGAAPVCDDGNACNGVESCMTAVGCVPGAALECDDGDVCNGLESCAKSSGCKSGTALTCNDGDVCNGVETCAATSGCAPAPSLACSDGDVCNGLEACEPLAGCVPGAPLACDNANACDGVEQCDAVTGCQVALPLVCADTNPCTDDGCAVLTGCAHVNNTGPCSDGNACTLADACASGQCIGTSNPCDDADSCTTDSCNVGRAGDGCGHQPVATGPATITISGVTPGAVVDHAVTANVTVAGAGVQSTVTTLDGAAWTSPGTISVEGAHTVEVTVAGCPGVAATKSVAFTIDTSAPELFAELIPPPNSAGWHNVPPKVVFHAWDAHSPITSVTPPVTVTTQAAGQVITGQAVDSAGHVTTTSVTVNTDFKAPRVSILQPLPNQGGNDQYVTSAATILVTGALSDDELSGFAGGLVTSSKQQTKQVLTAPGPYSVTFDLREGVNTVVASVADVAGNTGTASVCVIRDAHAPFVHIQSPSDQSKTTAATLDVTGLAQDLVVGAVTPEDVVVTVNGLVATVQSGQFVAKDVALSVGDNTITATATDGVGNTSTHSITVTRVTGQYKRLVIVSGDSQLAEVNTTLPEPLVVRMLDENDTPIPNALIALAVTNNDGTIDSATATVTSPRDRAVIVKTTADGTAQATLTLGGRAGAALNRVTASAEGVLSSVNFFATGMAAAALNLHAHAGQNQVGTTGQPLPMPLSVVVTDAGHNPVEGAPVTFEVIEGDAKLGGGTSVAVLSNSKGFADVVFTPGQLEGFSVHKVRASIQAGPGSGTDTELGVTFTASAFAARNPEYTAVRGIVVDENEDPIEGVTIRFAGLEGATAADNQTHTNAAGEFVFYGAPAGFALMTVDGTTATPSSGSALGGGQKLPRMTMEVNNVAGVMNTLDRPVYLLRLNEGKWVDGLFDVVLELPELPGFKLTVPAGTTVTFPDGSHEGVLSVTQVHFDQAPMAPINGLHSNVLVTIQPPGTRFEPPAPIQIPNVDGFAPGQKVEMFSFDHDLETFVSIGLGTVSEDATVLASDPGVGVVKGGWHCGANPAPNGDCEECAGLSASLAKTSSDPPALPLDLSGPKGLGGSVSTTMVYPGMPYTFMASGSPGKKAHWEFCSSGDFAVSGGSCSGQDSCPATVTATKTTSGSQGIIRAVHVCDDTGEKTHADYELRVCNIDPQKKTSSKEWGGGIPLESWGKAVLNTIKALGCTPSCAKTCTTGQACGNACIAKGLTCHSPPGSACDMNGTGGNKTPMQVTIKGEVGSQNICCPACPNTSVSESWATAVGTASFGSECATPFGISKSILGYALKLGLFLDFGIVAEETLGLKTNFCAPTPPFWCVTGGVKVTASIGGSVKMELGGPTTQLVSASGRVSSGVESNFRVECRKLTGKVTWPGIKGQVTLSFMNGAIKTSSDVITFVDGGDIIPEQSLEFSLPEGVGNPTSGGCDGEPPPLAEPACGG